MRAILQRVRHGRVSVQDELVAEIGLGYVVLLGVTVDDTNDQALWLAKKCANLRLFDDAQGKMNLSLEDVGGQVLVVSQFTLYADARKGRRPSFTRAALPEKAAPLVDHFCEALAAEGIPVQVGAFGEHMLVEIENDGPVTLILERHQGD
jgi:D-tyrosyl-tRNA(Tyr) deacylase